MITLNVFKAVLPINAIGQDQNLNVLIVHCPSYHKMLLINFDSADFIIYEIIIFF